MINYDLRYRKERGLMIHDVPTGDYLCWIVGVGQVTVGIEHGISMVIKAPQEESGFFKLTEYDRMITPYQIHQIFLVRDAIKTIEHYPLIDGGTQLSMEWMDQSEYLDVLSRLDAALSDAAL